MCPHLKLGGGRAQKSSFPCIYMRGSNYLYLYLYLSLFPTPLSLTCVLIVSAGLWALDKKCNSLCGVHHCKQLFNAAKELGEKE